MSEEILNVLPVFLYGEELPFITMGELFMTHLFIQGMMFVQSPSICFKRTHLYIFDIDKMVSFNPS